MENHNFKSLSICHILENFILQFLQVEADNQQELNIKLYKDNNIEIMILMHQKLLIS